MNELVKRLREYAEWAQANEWEVPLCMADDLEAAAKRIEEAEHENVDAVSVVRCKDCKYYIRGSCDCHSEWPDEYTTGYDCRPDEDDFCSYGERKESAEYD